ncbi:MULTISPECIES: family 43 glycosylhydrolase [Clostridia]|uniref:family 43 glycosylhydrolase n=1 Tax=Clostridia TaxID=186801 RepID=UPI0015FE1750|nr:MULTISPECIES: family 43 glycosylhydrolase [Clostridia]
MEHIAMNPYLPLYEYIPDGEPRIFENRLFVYGSHDFAGGEKGFCPGDYMVWSAPLDDLGAWVCEGVAFPRSECPDLEEDDAMAAPDVVQGTDGRYYMYWNTNGQRVCRVAVSDTPRGPFTYYGEVRNRDGTPYEDYKMFDPGVLTEDGKVYLFTGFCIPGPVPERFKNKPSPFAETSLGFELDKDMLTIRYGPVPVIPGANVSEGTGFEGHGFYEASSPRKINGKYVMVYSDEESHQMSYAIAETPLGEYHYMGVLVSNADIGINGNESPVMPCGNVHGGLVQLKDDWYIFYHRQTHGIECCRQGCAEKLPIRPDGWFGQAEITSCGLNQGALPAEGTYNACYCCHLTGSLFSKEKLNVRENRRMSEGYIYEESTGMDMTKSLHYLANLKKDTVIGFKYFQWTAVKILYVKMRGEGNVSVEVHLDSTKGECIGTTEAELSCLWADYEIKIRPVEGVHALYLVLQAEDVAEVMEITFVPHENIDSLNNQK